MDFKLVMANDYQAWRGKVMEHLANGYTISGAGSKIIYEGEEKWCITMFKMS